MTSFLLGGLIIGHIAEVRSVGVGRRQTSLAQSSGLGAST
jgi:hypothetical protein